MINVPDRITSVPFRTVRLRPLGCLPLGLALLTTVSSLRAADLTVPNGSFELPSTTFVDPRVDLWLKSTQPVWFDPVATGGITWEQLSGVFANTAVGQPNHIDNLAGNQAIFMITLPQVGLSQVLSAPEARFEPGFSYNLTLGILGGGGIPEGTAFQLGLFYLDGASAPVSVGATTVTYSAAGFPTITHLIDHAVETAVVQPGDAWAGKQIGLSLTSTSGTGVGYWDFDNVRLTSTAVPEPGTLALLGLGLGGVYWSVRRHRRQA